MRLASLDKDYWELLSAEMHNAQYPETFVIPPIERRSSLKRGDAAKLMFMIESVDEDGETVRFVERIFVIVAEILDDAYIGILDDQPASIVVTDDTYLCFGAEVPFLPEHVTKIDRPPEKYVDWQLSQPPERVWARE